MREEEKKIQQDGRYGGIYEETTYGELPHMASYLRYRAQVITGAIRARVASGGLRRIVDVGCGTGVNLPFLRQAFPSAMILGIDLSEQMLQHARAEKRGLVVGSDLCRASCFALPLGTASVDALLSTRFIHLFPHELKKAAYQEFRRVVRPGGAIIVEFYTRMNARVHRMIPHSMAWWRHDDAPQRTSAAEYYFHYPTRAEVHDIVGTEFQCAPVKPMLCRMLYRIFGEAITWKATRLLQYDPFAISYSEYLAIIER